MKIGTCCSAMFAQSRRSTGSGCHLVAAGRSVTFGHVGSCKLMYENYAFGDASLGWDHPLVSGFDVFGDAASAMAWLREGHARLRRSIVCLNDEELLQPRRTNWGEVKETRWIISTMIQHDLYHGGEINHIRALACGDDA